MSKENRAPTPAGLGLTYHCLKTFTYTQRIAKYVLPLATLPTGKASNML